MITYGEKTTSLSSFPLPLSSIPFATVRLLPMTVQMLILSAITPQTPLPPNPNLLFYPNNTNLSFKVPVNKQPISSPLSLRLLNASSSSSSSSLSTATTHSNNRSSASLLDEESDAACGVKGGGGTEATMVSSASALASAIRGASTSPVEFIQTIEEDQKSKLVLPSPDFQRLCAEQLDLFRQIVDPDAVLSVYVRPAGSYVMDRLELRRVTCYEGVNSTAADTIILVGSFSVPAGFRAAEAALSSQEVEVVPKHRAVIFPMVKHPFVVGFLVAELSMIGPGTGAESEGHDLIQCPASEETYALPPSFDVKAAKEIQSVDNEAGRLKLFTAEQRSIAINITRSLALAYVMDQKTLLLQQSSWQNNIRMTNLVEQIRGPLSSIRTLSKMLSIHTKRSELSYDIVEDILVQGDRLRDTLEELQDAVYLTKANIVRHNEEALKMLHSGHRESWEGASNKLQNSSEKPSLNAGLQDLEMPMPPLALVPIQQKGIRPCNVSNVLLDLVEAIRPLAHKQQRVVELIEFSETLQVAVEEPALRQALSNLIEGALLRTQVRGKIEIMSTCAPAGGALVIVDDDGPDMHYMTQMHSLTPFGSELSSKNMIEDNMTWNFVAGLTVAREILESYGCVIRVISPRRPDASLGAGGTRAEVWLPSFAPSSDIINESLS